MTVVTDTEQTPIQKLEAAVSEAEAKYVKANADAQAPVAAIMGTQPIDFVALAAAVAPANLAKAALDKLTNELSMARAADKWESNAELRSPILEALMSMTVSTPIIQKATSFGGSLTIHAEATETAEDGTTTTKPAHATMTLVPIWEKVTMDDICKLVIETVDVSKMLASDINDLVINIDVAKKLVNVLPRRALNQVGRASAPKPVNGDGQRAGNIVYIYDGREMGARDFLVAVEASGHSFATERARGFDVALREPSERKDPTGPAKGNGMSNLAKEVAKKLNVQTK